MARKQEFDQRNYVFSEIAVSLAKLFDKNNVAKLVVDNALCEEIIAIGCHSLCCFLVTGELAETRFLLFLN